ncbi:hypothetical protein GGI04_005870, partial [Coemansia thaxteri]
KLGEDDKNRRSATASPSNNNTAFNLFRQMDSRNQPAKAVASAGDGSLKSVHQNTITELRRDLAGNPLEISTSGLDGRLIQWNIQA